jgi:hypothetical protein
MTREELKREFSDYELEWLEAERQLAIIQWENYEYIHKETNNEWSKDV